MAARGSPYLLLWLDKPYDSDNTIATQPNHFSYHPIFNYCRTIVARFLSRHTVIFYKNNLPKRLFFSNKLLHLLSRKSTIYRSKCAISRHIQSVNP